MTFHRRRHNTLHPVRTMMRLLGALIFASGSVLILHSLGASAYESHRQVQDAGQRSTPVWLQWPQAPASSRLVET